MEILAVIVAVSAALVALTAVIWVVRGRPSPPGVESGGEGESGSLAQQVAVALDAQLRKVAAEVMTDNNEQFLTLATERFNTVTEQTKGLLQPVTSQMKQLGETVAELRKAHDAEKGAVDQMVTQMGSQINQLNHSTVSLAEALRSPTYRGSWGENQLRNIIEMAGMTRYCDFDEQSSGENREGIAGRPDVRVRLPNGAHLAVDAKTPFDAYWRAQQATEPEEIERELVLHATALKKHVDDLASKRYWEQNDGPAPEYVVLFVPGESFLADAARARPDLLEEAMRKQVLLASPVNLLALLWAVARGWQEARVSENARDIARLGEEVHDRMGRVLGLIDKTGRGLTTAVKAFNELVGSAEGRLAVTLRKFPELGAGSGEFPVVEEVEILPRQVQAPELDPVEDGQPEGPP
ncbi:MAG: DNA recombination protein RmuC [Actinomycetota bacterium]|nr:DNA recombination protein RmuC [Actinomycetota bacterium]